MLFSIGWQSSRDGASIKIPVFCNLKFTKPLISEMSNQISENNGVNRAGPVEEGSLPGRCSLVRQRGPGRHLTAVRTKWSKNENKIVMECFVRSKLFDDDGKPIRGQATNDTGMERTWSL